MAGLQGKHVWITGASGGKVLVPIATTNVSSGIGKTLAAELDKLGVKLSISARSSAKLTHICQQLGITRCCVCTYPKRADNAKPYPLDVRNTLLIQDTYKQIVREQGVNFYVDFFSNHKLGPIDIVVANAGNFEKNRE
jgi:NAD(P)-dependent dehydrogenase (short-subunit alcohol dehydrogenase family)